MNNETLPLIIFLFGLIFIIIFVYYSVRSENKEIANALKKVKPGDLYKWEGKYCDDDPFQEPNVCYAKIKEVKANDSGVTWVKYVVDGSTYTDRLDNFLSRYEFAEHLEEDI